MSPWTVAAVQMDCRLGRPADNLATVRGKLAEAAAGGARLVAFPECALTGYGLPDRAAASASLARTAAKLSAGRPSRQSICTAATVQGDIGYSGRRARGRK